MTSLPTRMPSAPTRTTSAASALTYDRARRRLWSSGATGQTVIGTGGSPAMTSMSASMSRLMSAS
jgi:hypothetical protein